MTSSFDLCFTLIRTGIRTSDSRSFKTFKMKYLYSKMVGHTRRRLILHLKHFVVYREKIFVRFFLFSRGLNFLFTTMHCSMFIICGTFPSKCFSFFNDIYHKGLHCSFQWLISLTIYSTFSQKNKSLQIYLYSKTKGSPISKSILQDKFSS